MFVTYSTKSEGRASLKTRLFTLASAMACVMFSASSSFAEDTPPWKIKGGDIPITVTLTDVLPEGANGGPIYVSIQTRENYRSMKGFGGIIPNAVSGEMTVTYTVDEPGDYSVSVWHDRDDDGRFSMTKTYEIPDSWGASGTLPTDREPNFDDVKVFIPSMGTNLSIDMINPASPS